MGPGWAWGSLCVLFPFVSTLARTQVSTCTSTSTSHGSLVSSPCTLQTRDNDYARRPAVRSHEPLSPLHHRQLRVPITRRSQPLKPFPQNRRPVEASHATIGQVILLSAMTAASVMVARPSNPSVKDVQFLQGSWKSVRGDVDERPTVTGNIVRWKSGGIDVVLRRLISPSKLFLNGWELDVPSSDEPDEIVWKRGDQSLKWTRVKDDQMVTQDATKPVISSGDSNLIEKMWSKGEIAMRVFKHLPSPAIPERPDETEFNVDVGLLPSSSRRFRFSKSLPQPPLAPQPSRLLKIQVRRPAGIVFERDASGQIVVSEIIQNGNADKQRKLGAFGGQGPGSETVRVGDVLRAFTTTTFEYGTLGLLGAEKPKKSRILFGVPPPSSGGSYWNDIVSALKSDQLHGEGENVFILERRMAPPGTPDADGYV